MPDMKSTEDQANNVQSNHPLPTVIVLPPHMLYKPKSKTKNPGILLLEGFKFYCHKIGKPRKDDGSIQFSYYCSDRDTGCRATATISSVKVS